MNKDKPIKVLIVDDEVLIVDLLCSVMEAMEGVIPLKAFDGLEALDLFNEEKPDIVFSDIYMPKLNGLVLLRKIKEIDKAVPVIIFTGYRHFSQMAATARVKPDSFLEKPLNIQKFIEIMYYYFPKLRKR
ncbi:MAG: response regulator [candidate division Zixibacteria bacterium]|nr:response regulator [Candidatus Tariuqbacter arcticus]